MDKVLIISIDYNSNFYTEKLIQSIVGLSDRIKFNVHKPNTDDMREAPSIVLANLLIQVGAHVRAYDPVAMEEAKHALGDTITYCKSDMDAVQGTDALALITEWTEFRVPNWEKVGAAMKTKVIFEGRNLYSRATVREVGFDYYGIGLKNKSDDHKVL